MRHCDDGCENCPYIEHCPNVVISKSEDDRLADSREIDAQNRLSDMKDNGELKQS